MERDNGGFIEKVLGGAFTIIVIISMLSFVLWLVVEESYWIIWGIAWTFIWIAYFYQKSAHRGSKPR